MSPEKEKRLSLRAEAKVSGSSDASLRLSQVQVHGLQSEPARPREPIEDEVEPREHAGGEPRHLGLHAHARILVEPAAGLDVDRLAGGEHLFEHVAVSVQPQDAVALVAVELVDEEPGAAEEH